MESTLNASNFAQIGASWGSRIFHGLKKDVRDWYELHRSNNMTNILVWVIYLELMLMAVLLIFLPFDTVQVGGRLRLIKPLNFAMSMALYLATVVVLLDYLRGSMWWKNVISWGVAICILTAITCITMQAVRGTTSHFNNSTPFDSAVSLLMDIADPLNSVFVLVLLIFALQSKYNVSRSSQLGIVFGIFIFLAGSAVGGLATQYDRPDPRLPAPHGGADPADQLGRDGSLQAADRLCAPHTLSGGALARAR